MNIKKCLLIMVVLTFCMVTPPAPKISAQEQESTATLDETVSWLKTFLGNEAHSLDNLERNAFFERKITDIKSVDMCSLSFTTYDRFYFPASTVKDSGERHYVKRLPLASLDPAGLDLGTDNSLILHTSKSEPKILVHAYNVVNGLDTTEQYDRGVSEVLLPFQTKEAAIRVKNALKHAIKLCGGKVDPF